MSPTPATAKPSIAQSVWRVVPRAVSLIGMAMTWACSSNEPVTSPASRAGVASHDAVHAPNGSKPELIPGQYIITFADSVSDVPGLAKRIAAQYGHEPTFTYTSAIKGFAAEIPDQAIEGLSHNPQIQRIEQDGIIHIESSGSQLNPNWGLDRIDQSSRPLDGMFSYGADGSGVNVYIIDTGIRTTHSEFGGRASGAFTAVSDGNGMNDCNGHGTGVAGVVGAATYGVAKAAKLFAVRVLDCSGSGSYSALISGIDWVTSHRVLPAVANISIAGTKSSTVNASVENSIAAGVVYAVAAANYSADACNYSPASAPHALTVAADAQDITSSYDLQASYSNFGSCVDLYAPGSGIKSAYNTSDTATIAWTGTSFSSPMVAGVAAMYLSAYPTASPSQVVAAIVGAATPGVIRSVGAGTVNLLLSSNVLGISPPLVDTTTIVTPPPSGSTQPPTASFSVNSCPKATCAFDGTTSAAANGIAEYAWTFGDGAATSSASGSAKVSHSYASKGTYTVKLTVTDKLGLVASASHTVTIKR